MVYLVAGGFILFDLVTGIFKALLKKEFTSSSMREGLFHKCGSVLCMLFGYFVDVAQTYVDIGVSIPVSTTICAYIIIMEIGSVIENICAINPEIMPEKIRNMFAKLSEGDENK